MHLKHRKIIDITVDEQMLRVAYVEVDNKVEGIYSITEAWSEKEVAIELDGTVKLSILGIYKSFTLKEIAQKIEEKLK